jgi:hypothetical protein
VLAIVKNKKRKQGKKIVRVELSSMLVIVKNKKRKQEKRQGFITMQSDKNSVIWRHKCKLRRMYILRMLILIQLIYVGMWKQKQVCYSVSKTVVTSHEAEFQEDAVVHKMLVCIVCDCCLIGNEPVFWISRETLKFHENVLSSTYFYKDGINPILKSQYSVSDELVGHLLLSP